MRERYGALRYGVIVLGLSLCATARAHAQATEAEHHEEPLRLLLDLVVGFDPAAFDSPVYSALAAPILAGAGTTESLLIGGSYELLPRFRMGARIGVGLANDANVGFGSSSAVVALSNLELEAEYELLRSQSTQLAASFAVTLPTAQGGVADGQSTEAAVTGGEVDSFLLQNLAQRAFAASRGLEDNALFAYRRIGLIPKVSLFQRAGSFRFEAYAKLEASLSTLPNRPSAPGAVVADRVMLELIAAGFVGYDILPILTAGLRVWTNLNLSNSDDSALAIEPQLRLQLGPVQAAAGLITLLGSPFGGPELAGLRLAAAARF